MKTTIIIGIFIVLILSVIAGCNTPTQTEDDATSAEKTAVNETQPVDIVEKRGQKTNITEFNELMRRASNIQSYKYNITDTGVSDDEYRFYVLGRFIKIDLPDTEKQPSGEKYDEVFLDRVTKTAFSHCSSRLCTKPNIDKGLEKVQYEKYYLKDPMEYLYFARDPQYVKEEMIGDETTKVFDITFEKQACKDMAAGILRIPYEDNGQE